MFQNFLIISYAFKQLHDITITVGLYFFHNNCQHCNIFFSILICSSVARARSALM